MRHQSGPTRHSPLDTLSGFLGMLFLGGVLGTWIGISCIGAEILHMPAWAWDFALVASLGTLCEARFASVMGEPRAALSILKFCGFLMLASVFIFFLTGFFGSPQSDDHPPGSLGATLDQMIPALSRAIAWATLSEFLPSRSC